METKARLEEVFQDVFDDESIEIFDSMDASDIEDWDSLNQIILVVSIEKEFKVKFSVAEVNVLENVGQMQELIESKLK